MTVEFEISAVFRTPAADLYRAWLDSTLHTAMTGGAAEVNAEINGAFTAWDGYIFGRNLDLTPPRRILQAWRTTEFEDHEPDSLLDITFETVEAGTQVTIRHSRLPAHGMQYKQGWVDNYFTPMKAFFTAED